MFFNCISVQVPFCTVLLTILAFPFAFSCAFLWRYLAGL